MSWQSSKVMERRQPVVGSFQAITQNCPDYKRYQLTEYIPSLNRDELKSSLKPKSTSDSVRLDITNMNIILEDADAIKNVFSGAVGNRPKINKSKFSPPYDLSDKNDVYSLVDVFFKENYDESLVLTLSYKNVLDYTIKIKTESGEFVAAEDLSAGMLSKAYISNFLDRTIEDSGINTVIIFDQPESNMEKSFLRTVLADKFNELRRTHQLFIATHEPLLVVNADANEINLANNERKVSENNHVTYSNRSFVGTKGKTELIENIADLIDGGSRAVKQRSDIYEGMKV